MVSENIWFSPRHSLVVTAHGHAQNPAEQTFRVSSCPKRKSNQIPIITCHPALTEDQITMQELEIHSKKQEAPQFPQPSKEPKRDTFSTFFVDFDIKVQTGLSQRNLNKTQKNRLNMY